MNDTTAHNNRTAAKTVTRLFEKFFIYLNELKSLVLCTYPHKPQSYTIKEMQHKKIGTRTCPHRVNILPCRESTCILNYRCCVIINEGNDKRCCNNAVPRTKAETLNISHIPLHPHTRAGAPAFYLLLFIELRKSNGAPPQK